MRLKNLSKNNITLHIVLFKTKYSFEDIKYKIVYEIFI